MKKTAIYQRKRADAPRWFNKWVKSPAWLLGFGVALAACFAVFAVNVVVGRVHPNTAWGWGYGIAAAVLFVGVMVYGVRRRVMSLRPGRTFYYLQFHLYGGALFFVLMLMHTGFRVPHGVLTWWLWFLSLWVVASGALGVLLQKWIPTMLNSGLDLEVNYERIPELTGELRERAEKLVDNGAAELRTFYRDQLKDAMAEPHFRMLYFFDVTGGARTKERQFNHLRRVLPEKEKETLDELQEVYRAKRQVDAHYTLQAPLRGWLYLHLPVSIVLVVLIGFHIFSVLYY